MRQRDRDSIVLTRAVCCECGGTFEYDPGLFEGVGMAAPRRCKPCRQARRQRLQPAEGFVVAAGDGHVIIRTDNGEFISWGADFPIGSPVTFQFDPQELPPAGRRRRASDVRLART